MLYSVKMRAAEGGAHECGGRHISGAERIVTEEKIAGQLNELVQRALTHTKGRADFVQLTLEAVDLARIRSVPLLPVVSFKAECMSEGRRIALRLLEQAGVRADAARRGLRQLAAMEENMRGALLLSAETGERLDQTGQRGVRVTGMDVGDEAAFLRWLEARDGCNLHLREAVVLAAKVAAAPGMVAELCWSDDPEYVTGYVAGGDKYQRISRLKEYGSEQGGRAFFVRAGTDLEALRDYLERQIVLVEAGGKENERIRCGFGAHQSKRAI